MPNHHRGEVSAELGGQTYVLCLTLGALAELEAAFGADDLLALAARFETGRLSARDAIRILGAGLRGAAARRFRMKMLRRCPATSPVISISWRGS